jgi:hypothetical protein
MENPMNTNSNPKQPSFKTIDREIRTLTAEMQQEQTLMPETQNGRIARLLKVYNGIKPLLTVISALPLIPSGWRRGAGPLQQRARGGGRRRGRGRRDRRLQGGEGPVRRAMPTRKIGRDASSGRFISVTEARERPATSIVDTIHVSRNGVRRLKRRRAVCSQSRAEFKAGRDL